MKEGFYFDRESKLIRAGDPGKMTPQQRANWRLIKAVLDSEYERGFERGLECGKMERKESTTLDMHTRPYNPDDFPENA
jgi:hypothetical protein